MKPATDTLLTELAEGSARERAAHRTIAALSRLVAEQDHALRLAHAKIMRFRDLTYRSYALACEAVDQLQQRKREP